MENSAASQLSVQIQLPSSSHHSFPKRYLIFSISHPSSYLLTHTYISTVRRTSIIPRAEQSKEGETPNSANLSSSDPPPSSPPLTKPSRSGSGFGTAVAAKSKRKVKGRSAVVRRLPIDRPSISSPPGVEIRSSQEQQGVIEAAFLLAWPGLGLIILIQGIALAASGFLPEQWDDFFVKYLYPSFTPACAVFVGGTVIYGVLKYLQTEKAKS